MYLADLAEIGPASITLPTGQKVSLSPDEELQAWKRGLERGIEECVVNCVTRDGEIRKAIYHALAVGAGLALGTVLAAVIIRAVR